VHVYVLGSGGRSRVNNLPPVLDAKSLALCGPISLSIEREQSLVQDDLTGRQDGAVPWLTRGLIASSLIGILILTAHRSDEADALAEPLADGPIAPGLHVEVLGYAPLFDTYQMRAAMIQPVVPDRSDEWAAFVTEQIDAIHAYAPNASTYRGLTTDFVKAQGIGPATRRGGEGLRHPWGEDLLVQGWDREFALIFTESPAWLCVAALTSSILERDDVNAISAGLVRAVAPMALSEAGDICGPQGQIVSVFVR
jgi:hypothetical protein